MLTFTGVNCTTSLKKYKQIEKHDLKEEYMC